MKKIHYRQYYWKDYSDEEIIVPDGCAIYTIECPTIHYKVNKEEYSKDYLLLCPTEFEDADPFGNMYINIINNSFIIDSEIPISDIESAPKLDGLYFVTYYTDKKVEAELSKSISANNVEEIVRLSKEARKISSILMLRKFTYFGIEAGEVYFKDHTGKDTANMSLKELDYHFHFEKCTNDPKIAELFQKEAEKIYKLITNEY